MTTMTAMTATTTTTTRRRSRRRFHGKGIESATRNVFGRIATTVVVCNKHVEMVMVLARHKQLRVAPPASTRWGVDRLVVLSCGIFSQFCCSAPVFRSLRWFCKVVSSGVGGATTRQQCELATGECRATKLCARWTQKRCSRCWTLTVRVPSARKLSCRSGRNCNSGFLQRSDRPSPKAGRRKQQHLYRAEQRERQQHRQHQRLLNPMRNPGVGPKAVIRTHPTTMIARS